MTDRPQYDYALIKPLPEEDMKSSGGIHMPSRSIDEEGNKMHRVRYGLIIDLGPGRYIDGHFHEPPFKVGDTVSYLAHHGIGIMLGGEHHLLIPSGHLLTRRVAE